MRPLTTLAAVLVLAGIHPGTALAAWPKSPFTNLPVCTAPGHQSSPTIVADGAGGAIVSWEDARGGSNDIYAQHLLASGAVDPAWPANGRALCAAAGNQFGPVIVADGAGGAIVAWYDYRGGASTDIYAQHVLASGAVDPAWPADGRVLCSATNSQLNPAIVADAAGGAIVAWHDLRGGVSYDIYAQHVLASGAVDPAWPANGRALCTATNGQQGATIVTDGAGGAIVAWHDYRGGANADIYAQHVLASGAVDPAWPADGRALCIAASDQASPKLVVDGAGGAIVTWHDFRSGTYFDIYAQHVLGSGAVDPWWPADGRALCTAASDQFSPTILADDAGGAIVTWQDRRTGTYFDIYAQHVLASGAVDPAWPVDGRALCAAANDQRNPRIVADDAGGALVAWYDNRGSAADDIYVQRVLASGAVDPTWPVDGRALCTAPNTQYLPAIVADDAGGAIVAWQDYRGGTNYDLYAQRVGRYGFLGTPEPEMASVEDVPNDQGGQVKLSWNASYLDQESNSELDFYDVLRSVPPTFAAEAAVRGVRVHALAAEAEPPAPGDLVAFALDGATYYWEYLTAITARHYLGGYSYVASTLGDSVAGSNPETAFMVVARNSTMTMWWPSRPMSGYSVDDLAPAPPAPFTGQYVAGAAILHWNPNAEADLAGYRLYRGTSAGFVPGPVNLVSALADTGYTDVAGQPCVYKLTAVDAHGNESPVATLVPAGALDVAGGDAPGALAFAPPAPNPAGVRTVLRFALPRAGAVRLAVYDAAGRQVRELASGPREPGAYAESWDLRDATGRAVPAGLYFARLEVAGRTLVRRVAVAR